MPKETHQSVTLHDGIGVDVGLKAFARVSNGDIYPNLNKSSAIQTRKDATKREQRTLARKLENKKKRGEKSATKGGRNIAKNVRRVQKIPVA